MTGCVVVVENAPADFRVGLIDSRFAPAAALRPRRRPDRGGCRLRCLLLPRLSRHAGGTIAEPSPFANARHPVPLRIDRRALPAERTRNKAERPARRGVACRPSSSVPPIHHLQTTSTTTELPNDSSFVAVGASSRHSSANGIPCSPMVDDDGSSFTVVAGTAGAGPTDRAALESAASLVSSPGRKFVARWVAQGPSLPSSLCPQCPNRTPDFVCARGGGPVD